MRWPWRKDPHCDEDALADAHRQLSEVRDQWPRIRESTAKMDRHREINGFTQAIRTAMGVDR